MAVEIVNSNSGSTAVNEQVLRELIAGYASQLRFPSSVYRLQMHKGFTFRQAREIIPYLDRLGVHGVYFSPFLQASAGSMHGYNIIDPTRFNEEIGTREDYDALCADLKARGLSQVEDIVPNHMGIKGANRYWMDVLENGPSSIYAGFFDINWNPEKKEMKDKVLIPILGDAYGKVLERGELKLVYTGKEFLFRYWETELPVNPRTYPVILERNIDDLKKKLGEGHAETLEYLSIITAFRNLPGGGEKEAAKISERNREKEIAKGRLAALYQNSEAVRNFVDENMRVLNGEVGRPSSFDALNDLLNEQSYRVAFWRVASEEINYRRFFDINDLAALRIESDPVFEEHHRFIFDLVGEEKIQGLRVDHPDGLYDPPTYFQNLQKRYLWNRLLADLGKQGSLPDKEDTDACRQLRETFERILGEPEFRDIKPLYVVIEKILDREEKLPESWKVHGTVGYEYINVLNGLFVDSRREKDFSALYERFIGRGTDFEYLLYEKKKAFALIHMASEINNLGGKLKEISEKNRHFRDFTRANLILAIREIIASFPVYRTYISPKDTAVSRRDEKYILTAVNLARRRTPNLASAVYEFLRDVLMLKIEPLMPTEEDRALAREFVLRFQQLTGPIMAKGLEDTTFYIYNRLLSLNEVGGDPNHFGSSPAEFHRLNQDIASKWPGNLVAGTTHDTKRSEDVRMRLNVLSEIPEQWETRILKWSLMNEKYRTLLDRVLEPRRNTEYFIYQTLLGVWPDEDVDETGMPAFIERIWQYVEKALREAKVQTNWVNPNTEYENAVKSFLDGILRDRSATGFLSDFLPFQKMLSFYGKLNALSAIVLRFASPGVVDIYQGTELWNYSLVDPDNRRPVDYSVRAKALESFDGDAVQGGVLDQMLNNPENGSIKLFLAARILSMRRKERDLFVHGGYVPLKAEGERTENVTVFIRTHEGRAALCAAGRFFVSLYTDALRHSLRSDASVWKGLKIPVPAEYGTRTWRDVFTGAVVRARNEQGQFFIDVPDLFPLMNASLLITD